MKLYLAVNHSFFFAFLLCDFLGVNFIIAIRNCSEGLIVKQKRQTDILYKEQVRLSMSFLAVIS